MPGWIKDRLCSWLNKESDTRHSRLGQCDLASQLQTADIILVSGRSRLSRLIKVICRSPWTHVAIYIGKPNCLPDPIDETTLKQYGISAPDEPLVIEALLGQGTIINPVSKYQNELIRICRPRALTPKDKVQLIRYATQQVGTDYDARQLFDLARYVSPVPFFPRHWRSRLLTPQSERRLICSTMLAEAFGLLQYPILPEVITTGKTIRIKPLPPRLCLPRDFDESPFFDSIDPELMLSVTTRGSYKKLPWAD